MQDKLLAALIITSMVAALLGGFSLSYVMLQPKITNVEDLVTQLQYDVDRLQNSDVNLTNSLQSMKNMSWHEVYSLVASSNTIGGYFQLKGTSVRVMWLAYGVSSNSWVSYELDYQNGTTYGYWMSSGLKTGNNAVLELDEIGTYYLNITTYQTAYAVSVGDYY
jgi:hypothetical protein